VDLDDGTGVRDHARLEVVDDRRRGERDRQGSHRRRRRWTAPQRLEELVDRLRYSPSDGEPQSEPLPALREAMAEARRLQR
jgi:hypothetical protein